MNTQDPYQILSISKNCTEKQLKTLWAYLVQKHHPDKGGNLKEFQIINKAYKEVLANIKTGNSNSDYSNISFKKSFDREKELLDNSIKQRHFTLNDFNSVFEKSIKYDDMHLKNSINQIEKDSIQIKGSINLSNFNSKFEESKKYDDIRLNRTIDVLEKEMIEIDKDIEKIQSIFKTNNFDNNTFQQIYEKYKYEKIGGISIYKDPDYFKMGGKTYTSINDDNKISENTNTNLFKTQPFILETPKYIDKELLHSVKNNKNDITCTNNLEEDYMLKMNNSINNYKKFSS
jgi:curved DNA-binding protein CbpA